MSDNDWRGINKTLVGGIVVAFVGIGLFWAMFYNAGYQSGRQQERASIERKYYTADTTNRIERECSEKQAVALRNCITEIVASEHENKRDESDLAAQWKAADWVFWASVIAAAQLVATIIGLYFIKGTLDATAAAVNETSMATTAMERQNEISEASSHGNLRPYLYVKVVSFAATWLGPKLEEIRFKVEVRNFGRSPGKKATVGGNLGYFLPNHGTGGSLQWYLIGDLPPGDVFECEMYGTHEAVDLTKLSSGEAFIRISGHVDYWDTNGNQYYSRYSVSTSGNNYNSGVLLVDDSNNDAI